MKSWAIFFKEWREMIRDQRVIFGVFVGPLLFTVGLFAIMGTTVKKVGEAAKKDVIPIAAVHANLGKVLIEPLEATKRFKFTSAPSIQEGEQLLKDGKVKLVMEFTEDVAAGMTTEKTVPVRLIYDPSETRAELALRVVQTQISELNKKIAQKRLEARSISPSIVEPFKVETKPLSGRSEGFLTIMIPYFLMLWSLIGGMTIASDLIAGEKERGTMETLLTSPASRMEVVGGKFMALLSQAWVGLVVQIVGLGIGWTMMPTSAKGAESLNLNLTPTVLAITFIAILPYSVFNTALLFALSTYARNQREAQGYVSAVSFALIIPLVFAQFMGYFEFSKQWWIGLLPVLNVFQVVRGALAQQLNWSLFGLALGSMSLLALFALGFAMNLFKRESVLFRV